MSSHFGLIFGKNMQIWAKRLLEIRTQLKKSQKEMAEFIGIPQRTWANYESGRSEPKIKVLIALADKGLLPDVVNSYAIELDNNTVDEKSAKIAELQAKIKDLETKNEKLEAKNNQLNEELLEKYRALDDYSRRFLATSGSPKEQNI
jgi:transcriptional regulator with XRE-family HTH domain